MNIGHVNPIAGQFSRLFGRQVLAKKSPMPQNGSHRALIAGYFSTTQHQSTFGDTTALRVVLSWMEKTGIPYDVACLPENGMNGLNLAAVNPSSYTILLFVCGPWNEKSQALKPFHHCFKIGINLSLESTENHGFDLLLPRDMPGCTNPDLVFATQIPQLPLAGIAKVHPQPMYGSRQCHERVNRVIDQYLARQEVAEIPLDTLWQNNPTGIRNTVQFDNLIRRMDVVITSRLHGLAFALKNGIPAIAIDPVAGGAKVTAQAKAVGWPLVFDGSRITAGKLRDAVNRCLHGEMNAAVEQAQTAASAGIIRIQAMFMEKIATAIRAGGPVQKETPSSPSE